MNAKYLESLDEALDLLNEKISIKDYKGKILRNYSRSNNSNGKYVQFVRGLTDKNISDGIRIIKYESTKSDLNINILSKNNFSYPKGDESQIVVAEVFNSKNSSIDDVKSKVIEFVYQCRDNKFYNSNDFSINILPMGDGNGFGIIIEKLYSNDKL